MRFLPLFILASSFVSLASSSAARADDADPLPGPRAVESPVAWTPVHDDPELGGSQPSHRRSVPLLIAGSVLAGVGAGLGVAGGVVYANATNHSCAPSAGTKVADAVGVWLCATQGAGAAFVGIGGMAGGGLLTVIGVPMIVGGAWKVKDDAPKSERQAALTPKLLLGPGTAGLRMSF